MAEPASTTPPPARTEMSVTEARTRFLQLVRLTRLTRQTTVIVDQGQPVAAIVGPDVLAAAHRHEQTGTPVGAAGWIRRVEAVRADLRRQHAAETTELTDALDQAWRLLDALRPAGADRSVDTLRAAHAPLRQRR
jgi:hypothetical protein